LSSRARLSAFIWLFCVAIFPLTPSQAQSTNPASFGPIQTRNHHPLYTGLLYPVPESGTTVKDTTFNTALNYTNIFLFDNEGRSSAFIDKELAELDLSIRYPLADGKVEIGAEAPFYSSSAGFMDGAVRWYHDRLGVPGYEGQAVIPDYTYSDVIRRDGKPVMRGARDQVAPGDASFWIKAEIFSKGPLTVSLQGLTQAPTGNADRGEGSGEWEFGARALATILAGKFAVHLGGGGISPGRVKRSLATTSLNSMLTGFISYERFVSGRFRLLIQSMFNTSPFEDSDLERFRKRWIEATFGFKYQLKSGSILAVGFSENLNRTAPDFTIHFSLEK